MAEFAFESIAQELRRRIIDGEIGIGGRLPSERELSEEYGVSLGTARVALKALLTEGTIDGGRGQRKTVVRVPRPTAPFGEFRSFAQWASQRGLEPGGTIVAIEWQIAARVDEQLLGLSRGSRVLHVVRRRTLDGANVMLEHTRYPEWLGLLVEKLSSEAASVTAVLAEQHGIQFSHAEHVFGAEGAEDPVTGWLDVSEGTPLLVHRRLSRNSHGEPLEWAIDRYLTGKVMVAAGSSKYSNPLRWTIPSDESAIALKQSPSWPESGPEVDPGA